MDYEKDPIVAHKYFIDRMISLGMAKRTESGPCYAETKDGTPIVNQTNKLDA